MNDLKVKGATVHVTTLDGEGVKGQDGGDWGGKMTADLELADVNVDDGHAIVLPGGQINPVILRLNEFVVSSIRKFADSRKSIAAICHTPWLLIEADIIKGREATSCG